MTILNHQTLILNSQFEHLRNFMLSLPNRFANGEGTLIHDGRNKLRCIEFEGNEYVVKSFKRPNFINRCVYGVLRPSKAKRAYRNALLYLKLGVSTPMPVGYLNIRRGLSFDKSYFVTLKSSCPWRYEDLFTHTFSYADDVLEEVGRITAILHNHGLAHKDYGRANILFEQLPNGKIHLDIVDLNRMDFGPLDIKKGCKNLERLPATAHMHRIIANAYAKERHFDADECYHLMRQYRSTQPGQIKGEF